MASEYVPADEYIALRSEISQGKKYVFERPLLIITVSLAVLKLDGNVYDVWFPPIAISFILFNLWFTVNRMKSTARIVAYIQIEFEEKIWRPWLGWETCLRHYRLWMNKERRNPVTAKNSLDAVPNALGYYRTIYIMHVLGVILLFVGSLHTFIVEQAVSALLFLVITLGVMVFFMIKAFQWRPSICEKLIEECRIRWLSIFEELASKGIRYRASG